MEAIAMQQNYDEPILTADELAKKLKLSKSWVYHEAAKGRLPCIPGLGVSKRFFLSEVLAYRKSKKG